MAEQKTGWLSRLRGTPKKSACCSFTIEEMTDEETAEQDVKSGAPAVGRSSCCGPAFDPARGDAKSK